jgi:ParB family transcriptional regulator, chromosome partitioning protein
MDFQARPKHWERINVSNERSNAPKPKQVIEVKIADIVLGKAVRPLDNVKLSQIEASIRDQGLQHPIHLYRLKAPHQGKYGLAAGQHRLHALINLSYQNAPAIIVSRRKAKAWQWSENLHRAALKALEMSEAIVGYAAERENLAKVESLLGGQQPNDKGYSKLAKALGFDRKRIAEAYQHTALPKAVKDRIRRRKKLNTRLILNALVGIEDEKEQLKFLKLQKEAGDSARKIASKRPKTNSLKNPDEGASRVSPLSLLKREWKKAAFRKLYQQQKKSVRKRFVEECM